MSGDFNFLALAKIDGKMRKIRASGSMCEGVDDISLWYWDESPREVRKTRYSYPDDPEMANYVGNRIVTELPGKDSMPIGQVTVATRLPQCLDWLDKNAELGSIKSPNLLAMIVRHRIRVANGKE